MSNRGTQSDAMARIRWRALSGNTEVWKKCVSPRIDDGTISTRVCVVELAGRFVCASRIFEPFSNFFETGRGNNVDRRPRLLTRHACCTCTDINLRCENVTGSKASFYKQAPDRTSWEDGVILLFSLRWSKRRSAINVTVKLLGVKGETCTMCQSGVLHRLCVLHARQGVETMKLYGVFW